MSQHGDGQQASRATGVPVPLAKKMRRAFRAAVGMPKPKKKKKPGEGPAQAAAAAGGGVSVELVSSSSSLAAARKEEVVRVVLRGGVVEVYPGVVLACTVIRNHPPGLCLAHPDVFRNPHGAVVRPREPLFPGQKFLLVPWTTVVKLKQKIPEGSVGAFPEEEEGTGSEEEEESSGAEEEEEGRDDGPSACSARAYFEARDRWSDCRFKRLVHLGLAVEPSKDDEPERKDKAKKKAGKKKKNAGKRRRPVPLSAVRLRTLAATPRRTWEPSLPAVVEENVSPLALRPASSESEETIVRPADRT
ncbi:hypothetical protein BS78_01G013200 [Paspalum vaginatum]|nr:hypothetical protein BS78_01G013200 [Paspalum vaginatum]